ncbi:MAG: TonB-dependent receptor, partial [Bacteroidales bacterium]|nr:TonB-dependent receptor [Bacteroidales bacterium]
MKKTFKCFLAVAAFLLMIVPSFAQITTANLAGQIVDEAGAPLIGAAVVAVHTPSGTQYYAVTNEDGRYAIQGMRTGGPYEVTYSLIGCQTVVIPDIVLSLAETYQQNVMMKTATELLNEAIVVASASSKFSTEKTGAATNISNQQITNLPSVSRAITDVTRLSPYGSNGMSFAGADGRTANFTVDGANFNNNFGLSSNLPGGGNPISIDAIEELQVVISPYDVRQTNFIGGGVNAITKSGTNTFRGSAYIYHKNENMQGDAVEGEQITGARAKNRSTTYGFTA